MFDAGRCTIIGDDDSLTTTPPPRTTTPLPPTTPPPPFYSCSVHDSPQINLSLTVDAAERVWATVDRSAAALAEARPCSISNVGIFFA